MELDASMHHTNVGHGDIAVQVILAIATNTRQEFHVNTANRGAIANLPAEAIVEVPALIDGSGVRPLSMGELRVKVNSVLFGSAGAACPATAVVGLPPWGTTNATTTVASPEPVLTA